MRRLRKILAAVDGSPASLHALREAIRLAQWVKGGVTVITVAPSYEGDLSLIGVKDIKAVLQGECEAILSEAMEVAEEQDLNIQIVCEQGEISEEIVKCSEREGIDLIVVGNAVRPRFVDFFKGGVLTGLDRYSRRDILVVPQGKALSCKRVLLAMDHPSSAGFIRRAVEIASSAGGELMALYVAAGLLSLDGTTSGRSNPAGGSEHDLMEQVRAAAKPHGLKFQPLVANGSAARTIARVAQEQSTELVLLASGGDSWLHQVVGPSLAERVARRCRCSVLVLKSTAPPDSA